MPNWCMNNVTIIVEPAYAEHVKDLLKDDENFFNLNKIHPRPTVTNPTTGQEEAAPNWYEWSIENWGTKWDVDCNEFEEDVVLTSAGEMTMLLYSFDSAWAPPLAAMEKLSVLIPYAFIHIAFDEPGMDFSGAYAWINQQQVFAQDRDFSVANALYQNEATNVLEETM